MGDEFIHMLLDAFAVFLKPFLQVREYFLGNVVVFGPGISRLICQVVPLLVPFLRTGVIALNLDLGFIIFGSILPESSTFTFQAGKVIRNALSIKYGAAR